MQRRTSVALIAFISSLTLLAGCGGGSGGSGGSSGGAIGTGTNNSSQPASAELSSAISALANTGALTATIKTTASASQISSLATAHGTKLTSAETSAIAGADISIELAAPSGKKLSQIGNGAGTAAFALTVASSGTTYLSLRSLNKTLYLQADLKDLLNLIGKGSTYASIQAESAALPSFVQALLADKWVSLPDSTLKSLEGVIGAGSTPSPAATPNPSSELAVIGALKSVLTTDVKATRTSAGKTDTLALSANLRTLATGFLSAVSAAVPAAGAIGGGTTSGLPNQNIALTASVTGGALSELSINAGQFDKSENASIPINVFFTGGAAITVPSGAVAVDSSQLSELFSGLAGGLGGSSSG
jgi:hypothetical protein